MKVDYRLPSGHQSTAYLNVLGDGWAKGADKHTDDPVELVWDGSEWKEVEHA